MDGKENEQFKQTRGLIELVSRLLNSVWERKDNGIFPIGPQHFALSMSEVREKLTEISGMRDVIHEPGAQGEPLVDDGATRRLPLGSAIGETWTMAVPDFPSLMLPVLKAHASGSVPRHAVLGSGCPMR